MSLMTEPDIWFTLYALAQQGAIHRRIIITTSDLGKLLNISQQTASRRIMTCVNQEYVERTHSSNGMLVKITKKGVKVLDDVLKGLETAFTQYEDEFDIRGRVMGGLGEGAYYVEVYSEHFEKALGFRPYPGTLNILVQNEGSRIALNRMRRGPPLIVKGFTQEDRTFGDVICYRVKINGSIDGAVVIAQRTHHSENVIEIIAPINLREELNLEDGSSVTLTIIPLHRAD